MTACAIPAVVRRAEAGAPIVAILWGGAARTLKPHLGPIPRVESAHPSPLSASKGFFGSRPFSRVNPLLVERGGAARGLVAPAGIKLNPQPVSEL